VQQLTVETIIMTVSEKKKSGWKLAIGKRMRPEEVETAIGELARNTAAEGPVNAELVRIDVTKDGTTVFVVGNKKSAAVLLEHLSGEGPTVKSALSETKVSAIHSSRQ
jgi:hypothetical protein